MGGEGMTRDECRELAFFSNESKGNETLTCVYVLKNGKTNFVCLLKFSFKNFRFDFRFLNKFPEKIYFSNEKEAKERER